MYKKIRRFTVLSFTIIILIVSSCLLWYLHAKQKKTDLSSNPLVNLVESTHIIRTLIINDKLESLLEDYDQEKLTLLLDNISPAKMAFEVEVLSTTIPYVIVYYFQKNEESTTFIQNLKKLAITYDNAIKFVVINADKLFSLIQDAEIEIFPTILIFKNREVIKEINNTISITQLERIIKKVLS